MGSPCFSDDHCVCGDKGMFLIICGSTVSKESLCPSSFMRMFRIFRTCSIENSSLSDYTYLYVLEKFRFMFCGFIKSDLYSKPCSKYQRYIELQSFLENEIMPYLDVGDFLLWDRILPGQ